MSTDAPSSRIQVSIDLARPGRQVGDLQIRWSDNRRPIGCYPVPIFCLANGDGPTVLLTGGVHGDEFEGPAALMRLAQSLPVDAVNGRVILIPALNAVAVNAASRVSPLDGVNLNRAFPGDADGGPTQMLAHFVESVLLPQCDAAIDLHSGGQASVFAPCTLAQIDGPLGEQNRALAEAFGAPFLWVSGPNNDDRSLNAAAARQNVTMIAAELGGSGGCDPAMTDLAEAALTRCLNHLGVTDLTVEVGARSERITPVQTLVAPAAGLFDRRCSAGDRVVAGESAGVLHFIDDPGRDSHRITFDSAGVVLAHTNRGVVERGDLVAMIAKPHTTDNGD
jgi:predicted deacylase